jgi:hypothetical protein
VQAGVRRERHGGCRHVAAHLRHDHQQRDLRRMVCVCVCVCVCAMGGGVLGIMVR